MSTVARLTRLEQHLWAGALLVWLLGDTLTTAIGLRLGLLESSTTALYLAVYLDTTVLPVLIVMKSIVLASSVGAFISVTQPFRTAIPGVLLALGSFACLWNVVHIVGLTASTG